MGGNKSKIRLAVLGDGGGGGGRKGRELANREYCGDHYIKSGMKNMTRKILNDQTRLRHYACHAYGLPAS